MSQAIAGKLVAHRYTVLAPVTNLPAPAASISIVATEAVLTETTSAGIVSTTVPSVGAVLADGTIVVSADLPPDAAGKDLDITVVATVGGIQAQESANLGVVGEDIAARLDAQDACLEEIKEEISKPCAVITVDSTDQLTRQTVYVNDSNGIPINCVRVSVTSDESGNVLIAEGTTSNEGKFCFEITPPLPSTIYLWRCKCGCRFVSPVAIEVV